MLQKKAASVIILFSVINFLPAQDIDRALYTRMTYSEFFSPASEFLEYFEVDVVFVHLFEDWEGLGWRVAPPEGGLTGFSIGVSPNFLTPEKGQLITIFFRFVPAMGFHILDYWEPALPDERNSGVFLQPWQWIVAIGGVSVATGGIIAAKRKK
jgi:hypothetical protein